MPDPSHHARWLASVQTAADAAPTPFWQYALAAGAVGLAFALFWLLPHYLDSNTHRRRAARTRRLQANSWRHR